jgi:hypothetical protein
MLKYCFVLLLAAAPLGALQAQSMPVSQFLGKAEALKKKGPLALFSSDLKLLKAEIQKSGASLRAERLAAKAAGRRQAFCPPEGPASLNSEEVLNHMRSIPAAQRPRMPVREAMRGLMARKYPCPA